jgi:DNA-binding LacI/PurR family transcriptional regulator
MIDCLPRQRPVVKASSPAPEQADRQQTRQIAIIAPVSSDTYTQNSRTPWTSHIIHAMEQALFETGYATGLVSASAEGAMQASIAARLDVFGSSLVGALCFPHPLLPLFREELERRRLPWVAVNRPELNFSHNFVTADHHEAGRRVGSIFAECGFEQVLLLASKLKLNVSGLEQNAGFFQGYMESGVSTQGIRVVPCPSWEEMDGYKAVRNLLVTEGYRPQAVFTTGDFLAMGAIRAFHEGGLRVPDDVSVVGATGLPISKIFQPPLSVVVQPTMEIGRNAAFLLHEMASEGIFKCAPRQIPCKVILRESVKLPEALRRRLERNEDEDVLMETAVDGISMQSHSKVAEAAS